MSCCKCLFGSFLTLIMILLNVPLVLISIAFMFFGIMTAFFFSTLVSWFYWVFASLLEENQETINNFLTYLDDYALGFGIALLVSGIIMFFIAFLGGFGACCVSTCMMTVYAILIGVMALAAIVTSIIFLVDSTIITAPLEKEMLRLVSTHFDDPDNPARLGNYTDIDAVMLTYISVFRLLECCGVTNYTDFQQSKKWNKKYDYDNPSQFVETAIVPVMCCKDTTKVNGTSGYTYFQPGKSNALDTSCMKNPTKDNAYIEKTCMTSLTSGTTSALAWFVFGASIGLLILFAVSLFLAFWYKKKEQNSHDFHSGNKYA